VEKTLAERVRQGFAFIVMVSVRLGLGSFFLFGAVAGLFTFAAGLVAFFAALAFLVAFLVALFVFLAALLSSGGGGIGRSGGFLGVTVDTESESKGCYSEDLFHMMMCEVGVVDDKRHIICRSTTDRVTEFKICSKKCAVSMFFLGRFSIQLRFLKPA
jgi:hypothetical protein